MVTLFMAESRWLGSMALIRFPDTTPILFYLFINKIHHNSGSIQDLQVPSPEESFLCSWAIMINAMYCKLLVRGQSTAKNKTPESDSQSFLE